MGLRQMIKNSSQLSENKIQNTIVENFDEIAPFYYKLLSEWTNSSYETFQDIDKYLIILYLINKDFDYYIQNGLVESYDTFFLFYHFEFKSIYIYFLRGINIYVTC